MIKIDLMEKSKPLQFPVLLGVIDLNKLNWPMLILAFVLINIPPYFLDGYFAKEIQGAEQNLKSREEELQALIEKNEKDAGVKETLEKYKEAEKKLIERSQQVEKITQKKTNPQQLLERMARTAPEEMWFTNIKIDKDKKITIEGQTTAYKHITVFLASNNDSRFFEKSLKMDKYQTEVIKVQSKDHRVEKFTIVGQIKNFDAWGSP